MRARLGPDRGEQRRGLLAPARRAILDDVESRGRGGAIALAQAAAEVGAVRQLP